MEKNTCTYNDMYEGKINIVSRSGPSCQDYDSKYYEKNIGFEITRTHKFTQDKPDILIMIPADEIICFDGQEGKILKRLKNYLLKTENDTSKFTDVYEEVCAYPPNYPHDKTTLTGHVPIEKFGIEKLLEGAADYCLRAFIPYIDSLNEDLYNRSRPDSENGKYYIHHPGGEVLFRNAAYFALCPQKDYENGSGNTVYLLDDETPRPPKMCLCIRMQVQLPQKKIKKTIQMLCRDLPKAVEMYVGQIDTRKLNEALELSEKQAAIRAWLKDSEYCAFIANGSILPRSKGTDLPLQNAVPFQSPADDETEVCGIRGMGIKRGVSIITGGGYSGKSTLLDAISAGVYNHVQGDGRELCITDDTAMTISAEDGRSVKSINISPFIKWLPGGNTCDFSTDRASGSTSQAANIMEAVEYGSKLLLIDEDLSATNFMIRDKIMKELIKNEPITPFTDRVNELYHSNGVSSILVIGGSGEYIATADKVYMMNDFRISDVTIKSKEICNAYGASIDLPTQAQWTQNRIFYSQFFSPYPEDSGSERLAASDIGIIVIGDECIDTRGIHDLITKGQLNALAYMLRYLETHNNEQVIDLDARIDEHYELIEKNGLDAVFSSHFTTTGRFLDLPRKQELKAVINRMRKIVVSA